MTRRNVPEADWKYFRELRELALERFCARVLRELRALTEDSPRSSHQRYLDAFKLIRERDRELAAAFDGMARSRMREQLRLMQAYGLFEPGELDRFSAETRQAIEPLAGWTEP